MTTYFIHESNLERLEKKIQTIKKKCTKNNLDFTYRLTGNEEYRTIVSEEGHKYTARFVEVEVEGSIRYEGWRFVATLDHHEEGNIVRAFDTELEIPDKYFHCGPACEHCNKIRSRKDTYLIYNNDTAEFKQVGRSCMAEYTKGLNAEEVAWFISLFDEVIKGEYFGGSGYTSYMEVSEMVRFAFECVKHFGYEKSLSYDDYDYDPHARTTKSRVRDYFNIMSGRTGGYTRKEIEVLTAEMDDVNFDANSESAVRDTGAAIEWILSEDTTGNSYLNNLKVICSEDYSDWKNLGILASLPVAYMRHLDKIAQYEKKQQEHAEQVETSNYVGQEGQKVSVDDVKNFQCASAWDTQFGTTFLYKWTDSEGNQFTWFASKSVDDEDAVSSIVGTVKKHEEFRGVKQTILTRCKVAYS